LPSIIKVDQIQSDTGNVAFTGNIAFPAGSASSPSIQPVGDINTGIFFPAADTIAFAEGGTEVLRISNTANVGINTTNPTAKLNVVDGFVSYVSSDANGYPRFTTSSGSAQVGLFRSGTGSLGGGYIGGDGDNCLDVRDVVFETRMRVTQAGLFQMNSGFGSVTTAYGCRAWVNFSSNGTVRAAGNVSSVTQNGTGDYTINFTNAMPDTSYACALAVRRAGTNDVLFANPFGVASGTAFSTGSLRIRTYNTGPTAENPETTTVTIFR